jgi:hypothetical protein
VTPFPEVLVCWLHFFLYNGTSPPPSDVWFLCYLCHAVFWHNEWPANHTEKCFSNSWWMYVSCKGKFQVGQKFHFRYLVNLNIRSSSQSLQGVTVQEITYAECVYLCPSCMVAAWFSKLWPCRLISLINLIAFIL